MQEKIDFIDNYLKDYYKLLGIRANHLIKEDDDLVDVTIDGSRLNLLIGRHGQNLNALQYFISQSLFRKFGDWQVVNLDVNGYKQNRRDKIENMTKNYIDKVRFFKNPVEMDPMTPVERKFVHDFVNGYDDVTSNSIGEGHDRRVVISLKE